MLTRLLQLPRQTGKCIIVNIVIRPRFTSAGGRISLLLCIYFGIHTAYHFPRDEICNRKMNNLSKRRQNSILPKRVYEYDTEARLMHLLCI